MWCVFSTRRCLLDSPEQNKQSSPTILLDLAEPPTVDLTGSNNGQPVPYGDPVSLTCVPLSGLPLPTLEITGGRGFQLPSGTTTVQVGNNTITSIPSLTEDVCIDCIGTNLAGTGSDQECLRVLSKCPTIICGGIFQGILCMYYCGSIAGHEVGLLVYISLHKFRTS